MKRPYKAHFHCVYHLKFHLVLVTKYRNPCLVGEIFDALEKSLRNTASLWGVEIEELNGEPDHVHILLNLSPSIEPAKFINNLKTVSSRYLHKHFSEELKKYYWGTNALWSRSYCLITARGAPLEVLKEYIRNQKRQ